ncbi:MAG: exonuclease SbcCD subunit D [Bacillota bacterium]|jgi:exonuclease SbcD|nr:exonuclease SbcCD subunit D [Bacillota bacterium]HHT90148.1 exonuclease SbcCD subunit D [Bacillota bacterium]
MRFLHLADLHLGKRLNEFNLIGDQAHILEQIVAIAREEADAVLIAGDVYDKSQPSVEAVELLDDFLTQLTGLNLPVLMVSGNHDSPERLSFGSRILAQHRLHVVGGFSGILPRVTLEDRHGPIHVCLLPFVKPAQVRPFFDEKIESYDQAVRAALSTRKMDSKERNILVAHQFVVCGESEPERSDSETVTVGGLDSVDASAFDAFDYVALGHLHRPQTIGSEHVRYGGSPLKYSFSEARQDKSVTILALGPKGELKMEQHTLRPRRDLREIKGPLRELLRMGKEDQKAAQDYLRITLTDEEEIYDALGQLRPVFPQLMVLDFEYRQRGLAQAPIAASLDLARKSPLDLFASFYQMQNDRELNARQMKVMEEVLDQAGGEGA